MDVPTCFLSGVHLCDCELYLFSLSLTGLPNYILYCSSILSLSAVSADCNFEEIDTKRDNIAFPTTCLEADDRLVIKFDSIVINTFIYQVERNLQFIRDTASVTVVEGISVTRYIIAITTIVLIPISSGGTGENILQCQPI